VGLNAYDLGQEEFQQKNWEILPPSEARLARRLELLPRLSDLVDISQGVVSGADGVFIVREDQLDNSETDVFVPLLSDRMMERYQVPERSDLRIFYPFVDGKWLDERELRQSFPRTWEYLEAARSSLEKRAPVRRGDVRWWQPAWPRSPERLLGPKIVSPHLVMLPRFGLDVSGKYAVTRSCFMTAKSGVDMDMLKLLTGVLNSPVCYWYISTHSHKYRSGYAMLEKKTLQPIPIPEFSRHPSLVVRAVRLVEALLVDAGDVDAQREIELLVAEMYGVSRSELGMLGLQ